MVCLFVLDPRILGRRHHDAPARLRFLRSGLEALDADLRTRGSALVVREGPPERVVPAVALEAGAARASFAREVSPLGRARDGRVLAALEAAGVEGVTGGTDLAAEPDDLPGSSGAGYLVFTPFHRAWREVGLPPRLPGAAAPAGRAAGSEASADCPRGEPPLPAGRRGRAAAAGGLPARGEADRYDERRDMPGRRRHLAPLRLPAPRHVHQRTGGPGAGAPRDAQPGREAFWRQIAGASSSTTTSPAIPRSARGALREDLRSSGVG